METHFNYCWFSITNIMLFVRYGYFCILMSLLLVANASYVNQNAILLNNCEHRNIMSNVTRIKCAMSHCVHSVQCALHMKASQSRTHTHRHASE